MTSVEPELWVGDPGAALDFYALCFGATVLHRVGDDNDIVAQLGVGDARFWVSNAGAGRLDPLVIGGGTSRTLLVTADPAGILSSSVAAGARQTSPVTDEHGWRLARIIDPFGHEWEMGRPLDGWPPAPR
jgi:PhnB protein